MNKFPKNLATVAPSIGRMFKKFHDKNVPEVLLSGNHKEIEDWRLYQSLKRTLERRPDLLDDVKLSKKAKKVLEDLRSKLIL